MKKMMLLLIEKCKKLITCKKGKNNANKFTKETIQKNVLWKCKVKENKHFKGKKEF